MKAVRYRLLALACLGLVTLLPSDSCSSPPDTSANDSRRFYWVNLGSGAARVHGGLGGDDGGISGGISLAYQTGSHLFSFRDVVVAEFQLNLWGTEGPAETVQEFGVLYGKVTKAPNGLASISGGIGIVGASGEDERSSVRMGIPIEGQLLWTFSRWVGIGIYGFANVNSDKSFLGAWLCFQIGKLR